MNKKQKESEKNVYDAVNFAKVRRERGDYLLVL
jgi:hypothetical protein